MKREEISKKKSVVGTLYRELRQYKVFAFITPLFMGAPRAAVWELMPFIVAFNLAKAGINSLVTFLLYKRISPFLHK